MNAADIEYHKRKIQDIEQDFADFSNQIFKLYTSKKELILDWATHLEKLNELEEDIEPITTICYRISKRLVELGIDNADSYVRRILPTKYKDSSQARMGNNNQNAGVNVHAKEPAKPIALMDRNELRDYTEQKVEEGKELKRRGQETLKEADQLVQICEQKGIALTLHAKKEPISTPKDPNESASHIAMQNLIQVLESVSSKIYEMPPTPEDDAVISKGIESVIEYLKPLQDEKYSKSLIEWFRVQLENIAYGKHAAGSRKGTLVVIKGADGSEETVKRNLTKEQVGDRYQEILETACRILDIPVPIDEVAQEIALNRAIEEGEANGLVNVLSNVWHKNAAEPRIARRKINLHDTLSEQA